MGLVQQPLPELLAKVEAEAQKHAKDREEYDKFVTAGMRYMFQPKIVNVLKREIGKGDDPAIEVGEGVAGITMILSKNVGKEVTIETIIPAAITMMVHGMDAMAKAGLIEINEETVGEATNALCMKLLELMGITPQMLNHAAGRVNEELANPEFAAKAQQSMGGMQNGTA
jgi:hypothetical protein